MLTKTIAMNQRLIVHLIDALDDTTQVDILYSPNAMACGVRDFAPIRRQGNILTLSPANTPIVLELSGTYYFDNTSTDTTARVVMEVVDAAQNVGDILGYNVYSSEVNL